MKLFTLALTVALVSQMAVAQEKAPELPGLTQQDYLLANEEAVFAAEGFEGVYNSAKFIKLERFIDMQIESYKRRQESAPDKDWKEIAEIGEAFLKHARRVIEELGRTQESFDLAKRLVSSTLILDKERILKHYTAAGTVDSATNNKPAMTEQEQATVMGALQQLAQATKQDPSKLPPALAAKIQERMQRLVAPQASIAIRANPSGSRLSLRSNISQHNPLWKTNENLPKSAKQAWKELEEFWNKRISEKLGTEYDVNDARQVLFFDSLKTNATSPKFDAKDAWGRKVKVKAGDETQSEVVANRIVLAMGAKYTDLTYDVGGEDLIVIMPDDVNEIHPEATKLKMNALQALEHAMLMSGYQYRIANNIYSAGKVTEEIYNRFPKKVRKQLSLKKVEGKSFVRLKEVALEYKPEEGILFGSGTALSSLLAQEDSVIRSSVFFNLFVGNRDTKDDNSRSVLIEYGKKDKNLLPGVPVFLSNKEKQFSYVEYQSDIGNSLGDMFAAGNYKALKGRDFLVLRDEGNGEFTIRANEPQLYVPYSWNRATVDELVADAGRMLTVLEPFMFGEGNFNDEQIGWIVKKTNSPRFMQMALINRLVERMRGTLEILEQLNFPVKTADRRVIRFSETREYAPDFILSEENLVQFAKEVNISTRILKPYIGAKLLSKGQLVAEDDKAKALIRVLEIERFPSGLFYRVSRTRDHKPQLYSEIPAGATLMDVFVRPTAEQLATQEAALAADPEYQKRKLRQTGRPLVAAFEGCEADLKSRK